MCKYKLAYSWLIVPLNMIYACIWIEIKKNFICPAFFYFQVSDPVAAEFSLNTQMLLLSKRTLWLSDGSMGFGQESDTAFSQGKPVTWVIKHQLPSACVNKMRWNRIYVCKYLSLFTYLAFSSQRYEYFGWFSRYIWIYFHTLRCLMKEKRALCFVFHVFSLN